MKAVSSDSTKRFQRNMLILAPASGFHGAACAQAFAKPSNCSLDMVAAAASKVPPDLSKDRRSGVKLYIADMLPVYWFFFDQLLFDY